MTSLFYDMPTDDSEAPDIPNGPAEPIPGTHGTHGTVLPNALGYEGEPLHKSNNVYASFFYQLFTPHLPSSNIPPRFGPDIGPPCVYDGPWPQPIVKGPTFEGHLPGSVLSDNENAEHVQSAPAILLETSSTVPAPEYVMLSTLETLLARDPSNRLLVIPQSLHSRSGDKSQRLAIEEVEVSASLARAGALPDGPYWNRVAFNIGVDRADKKFQVCFQFNGFRGYVSKQHNEYCVDTPPSTPRPPKSARKMHNLVKLIADELYDFMESLEQVNTPLKLNTFVVDFNDIQIVKICRITRASIQVILAILPEARQKYEILVPYC